MIKNDPKIIIYKDIQTFSKLSQVKKIVLVGGCFDLLHFGHITFLINAKKLGDLLIVALESDDFIVNHKKREPIHTQEQRAKILSSLIMVDYVILLPFFSSEKEYDNLVKSIKPNVIAITQGDVQNENKIRQSMSVGGEVKVVSSLVPGFSTQKIIKSFISKL